MFVDFKFDEIPFSGELIDPSHKSPNASDKYQTMHHFVKEMYTHVNIFI